MDNVSLQAYNAGSVCTPLPLDGQCSTAGIPQIYVNGRRLITVVCARQYMTMQEINQSSEPSNAGNDLDTCKVTKFIPEGKNSIQERGYGDIASGIKVLELLQNEYPEAKMVFIAEHFAETENELRRIIEMSTLSDVKTIILDGNGNNSDHQKVRDRVVATLNDATVIFHAPAGLIEPLMNSSGEYKKKTLAVSEYDRKTGRYSKRGKHGIKEIEMGFKGEGLYLTPRQRATTGFNNATLDRLFPTNNSTGKITDDSFQKKALYFSYGHVVNAMNNMLRNAVLNESLFERDVVFVTSLAMNIDKIEQMVGAVLSANHLTQPIRLVCEENGNKTERIIPKDADGQAAKTFNIVSMNGIVKEDFSLLEQYSVFNYTSGDISTTNVLGFGKIPFVDCKKKEMNFENMCKKLNEFAFAALSAYEKAGVSGTKVPKEVWDITNERLMLIMHWAFVCRSLSESQNKLSVDRSANLLSAFEALNAPTWIKFQKEFTHWLKSTCSADKFILRRIRRIIAKSSPY